jgi:hypothetical protein
MAESLFNQEQRACSDAGSFLFLASFANIGKNYRKTAFILSLAAFQIFCR